MNKDSVDYFMRIMTQKEFEERTKGWEIPPYKFNMIRKIDNEEDIKLKEFYRKEKDV